MDVNTVDQQIETYLDELSQRLRYMSDSERDVIRSESRLHIRALATDYEALGLYRHYAVTEALRSFGDPTIIGNQFMAVWLEKPVNRDRQVLFRYPLGSNHTVDGGQILNRVAGPIFWWSNPLSITAVTLLLSQLSPLEHFTSRTMIWCYLALIGFAYGLGLGVTSSYFTVKASDLARNYRDYYRPNKVESKLNNGWRKSWFPYQGIQSFRSVVIMNCGYSLYGWYLVHHGGHYWWAGFGGLLFAWAMYDGIFAASQIRKRLHKQRSPG